MIVLKGKYSPPKALCVRINWSDWTDKSIHSWPDHGPMRLHHLIRLNRQEGVHIQPNQRAAKAIIAKAVIVSSLQQPCKRGCKQQKNRSGPCHIPLQSTISPLLCGCVPTMYALLVLQRGMHKAHTCTNYTHARSTHMPRPCPPFDIAQVSYRFLQWSA